MSDLPTREDAQRYWEHWNNIEMGGSPVVIIASAYADGELMTRKEFIDSLDWEAVAEAEHDQWMRWVQTIIRTEPGLSPERIARWVLYMVPYAMLSDDVKEYDRIEARKCLEAALGEDTK